MKRESGLVVLALLTCFVALRIADKTCDRNSDDAACHGEAALSDDTALYQQNIQRVKMEMREAEAGNCGAAPSLDGGKVDELISGTNGVLIIGDPNKFCTKAAVETLQHKNQHFTMKNMNLDFSYSTGANPVWDWLHCTYPNDAHSGTTMHSYVFRDGSFLGEGFAAAQALQGSGGGGGGGGAAASNSGNCDADFPSEKAVVDGYMGIATNKVLLFGWLGCPCTGIAQSRFAAKSLCYEGRQWADQGSKLMQYLQCKVGSSQHHSFIYFRDASGAWQFKSNGFAFAEDAMTDSALNTLISDSGAATTCKQANIKTNIFGEQLEECRSDAADMSGSWMDDGTCSEQTGGVHQICIEKLPADFSSETHQSAWSEGRKDKRHCVCIGAWSLYMTDADNHQDGANAITPHCKAISETAMTKRYLENWKDWNGFAANIVVGLKELVSRCIGQGNTQEKCELKARFDKVVSEVSELQGHSELAGLNSTLQALNCASS